MNQYFVNALLLISSTHKVYVKVFELLNFNSIYTMNQYFVNALLLISSTHKVYVKVFEWLCMNYNICCVFPLIYRLWNVKSSIWKSSLKLLYFFRWGSFVICFLILQFFFRWSYNRFLFFYFFGVFHFTTNCFMLGWYYSTLISMILYVPLYRV
jgi:hypothetical protein